MNLFQELKENAREESLNELSQKALVQKAIDIATSMGGNMTGAVKRIEKIKRNLSKDKNVANALRLANEETVSENADMVIHVDDKLQTNLVTKMASKFGLTSKKTKISWSGKDGVVVSGDANKLKKFMSSVEDVFKEETITENYRKLAKHGMGTETPKSVKVGTEIDYYQKDGAKYMGKVTKMSKQSYTVRDDKTKKDHEFFYHDRIKAAKLLKQGDNIEEKVDPKVLKAIEIAMKMGGNMTGAVKAIEKIKKNLSKHKDVMNALQFANESKLPDFEVSFIEEDYRKVIKMYPSDKEWKKLITKHRKAIDAFRKDNVDLPMKVEDELLGWASETGEVSGKHDAEDFIISILDESIEKNMTLSLLEKAYDQNDVKKVQQLEKKLQGMLKEVEKTMKGSGLSAPAFNNVRSGIVKGLESIEKFYKIANTSSEESSSAQQAAIAIAKKGKEKNESIMNTYRNVWEESLQEEMISYRVKGMQKPEEDKFKQSAKMMGLKITMDKGKKDTVIVMSGTKKKLRDFDSIARGKSSYGDPSTIMHFDEK